MTSRDNARNMLIEELSRRNAHLKTSETTPTTPPALINTPIEEEEVPEGKKEYAEIIGESHPSGKKYYFTTYQPEDFDEKVRDLIPPINENVVFDHEYALALLMSIEYNKTLFAFGPPGAGKTLMPEQVCARIGYPYFFVAGMGGTEPSDYIGSPWVCDGNMEWKDGPISFIVRHGGYLAYDEPFKSSAQTNMCIQSLLDHRATLKLYGHPDPVKGTLKAHPQFRMGLMDNVRGFGDDSHRYAAEVQDQSTLNRCSYKMEVGYPAPGVETTILSKMYPKAEEALLKKVVAMAGLIRTAWQKDDVSCPFSLRDTAEWVECALLHSDVVQGFNQTYYAAVNDQAERKAIKDAWDIVFSASDGKLA